MRACKISTRLETVTPKRVNVFLVSVIQSDVPPDNNPGLNFRFWRYATFAVSIKNPENLNEIYADTGCGVSLVDKNFLIKELPDYRTRIQTKPDAMKMRGLKDTLFITAEHFPINFNIPGQTVDRSPAIINFIRHVYIIKKFKNKMLINNMLNPEMMVPNIGKCHLTIGSCKKLTVKFNVKNVGPLIKRIIGF